MYLQFLVLIPKSNKQNKHIRQPELVGISVDKVG